MKIPGAKCGVGINKNPFFYLSDFSHEHYKHGKQEHDSGDRKWTI